MPIEKISGVYLSEEVDYELSGTGSKIPVFIGLTGNTTTGSYKVDGTQVRKYTNYTRLNKAVTAGGIGVVDASETSPTNLLNGTLRKFYEEARLTNPNDIGVPYIYVIDVGDGTAKQSWLNAVDYAISKTDADLLVFVGTENITYTPEGSEEPVSYSVVDLMKSVNTVLTSKTTNFQIFNAFFTRTNATTDGNYTAMTSAQYGCQASRIGVVEWDNYNFGKTIARICLTPYYTEVGYLPYRSVKPGTFKQRTLEQKLTLQSAGIIFNHDEVVNDTIYPRMNRCIATSYASTNRPADARFHARFIADEVLRQIYEVAYPFIKSNDTETNIVKLQVKV